MVNVLLDASWTMLLRCVVGFLPESRPLDKQAADNLLFFSSDGTGLQCRSWEEGDQEVERPVQVAA